MRERRRTISPRRLHARPRGCKPCGFRVAVQKESSLVAFADALSLALCGDLKAPMTLEAPAQNGDLIRIELADRPGQPFEFVLAPWPFSVEALAVEAEARPLPPGGRFSSEAAMRSWLASPAGDLQGNAVRSLIRPPRRRWILPN
jgi:hypothetical protein